DDVNGVDDVFLNFVNLFFEKHAPISLAVEPGNITQDAHTWLQDVLDHDASRIELVQHGWKHAKYRQGEFDDSRSYEEQYQDLKRGKERMEEMFGPFFFPMLTMPYAIHNRSTIRAADELGFRVFRSRFSEKFHYRLFYKIGSLLRANKIFRYRVSHHLRYMPGTRLFSIDVSMSMVRSYHGPRGLEMFSLEDLQAIFHRVKTHTSAILVLLHHPYHKTPESLGRIGEWIDFLKSVDGVRFTTCQSIFQRYIPDRKH
ncbi:MAG: polysaccharide deacetylase family protein, partial [Candidatus Omnitrophica bacterium]|nr:polysaccharide deacetylase family protein [Candidatus Omnitrophota bacterium]